MNSDLQNNFSFIGCQVNIDFREADASDQVETHQKHCLSCRSINEENFQMRNLLKRAVENTPVPEFLEQRIWENIRDFRSRDLNRSNS